MNSIKKEKHNVVETISKKLSNFNSLVVFSYHGLTVSAIQKLRKELTNSDIELKVYKNRLFKIAAAKAGFPKLSDYLLGPNAFALSSSEDSSPAKIIAKFAKEYKSLKMITGIYENKVVDSAELDVIATLPSYVEALTMLASSLISPLRYVSIGLNMLDENNLKVKEVETQKTQIKSENKNIVIEKKEN